MKTKEQIYDEEIDPLMVQIIEICEKNGIAALCSFSIPNESDADLCCTTILPGDGPIPKGLNFAMCLISPP